MPNWAWIRPGTSLVLLTCRLGAPGGGCRGLCLLPVPTIGLRHCGFSRAGGGCLCAGGATRLRGPSHPPQWPWDLSSAACPRALGEVRSAGGEDQRGVCVRESGTGREKHCFPGQVRPIHEFPGIIFPIKLGEVSFCHLLCEYSDSTVHPRAGLGPLISAASHALVWRVRSPPPHRPIRR